MKLNEAVQDKDYVITGFEGDEHFRGRISSMGLRKGVKFSTVKNKKKLPLLIYTNDTLIAIGRNESEKIMIGDVINGK